MPIATMSKISDESVKKATGKEWKEWLAILNKAGGKVWTHQDIVKFLKTKYKLGPWWQQMVTTSYEIAIGRREEGKNQKGFYSTVATKTFPLSKKKMWDLLNSVEGMGVWLQPINDFKLKAGEKFETRDGYFGEVRTMKTGERARLRWQEPEWERHTIVNLSHDDIPDLRLANKLREHWKAVMGKLNQLCKNS